MKSVNSQAPSSKSQGTPNAKLGAWGIESAIFRVLFPFGKLPVVLALLAGTLAGAGAYTFRYGEGLSYFSTDPRACNLRTSAQSAMAARLRRGRELDGIPRAAGDCPDSG